MDHLKCPPSVLPFNLSSALQKSSSSTTAIQLIFSFVAQDQDSSEAAPQLVNHCNSQWERSSEQTTQRQKMSLGATCRNANAQTGQNSDKDKDTTTFKGREESFFGGQRSLMTVVITSAGSLPIWRLLTSQSGRGPCLRQAQSPFGGKRGEKMAEHDSVRIWAGNKEEAS